MAIEGGLHKIAANFNQAAVQHQQKIETESNKHGRLWKAGHQMASGFDRLIGGIAKQLFKAVYTLNDTFSLGHDVIKKASKSERRRPPAFMADRTGVGPANPSTDSKASSTASRSLGPTTYESFSASETVDLDAQVFGDDSVEEQ